MRAFIIFIVLSILLTSCASSSVQREAAGEVDKTYVKSKSSNGISDPADIYQNASQKTRGAVIGGAAGAVTGTLTSGVGFFPGAAGGAIAGAAYGAYIDSNTTLEDQLINRNVNVIVLGDQIRVIIPSAPMFDGMTAKIRPQSYETLYLVSRYLNQYTLASVKISAHTVGAGTKAVNYSLSQEQARSVEKFLWSAGTNARMIYAVGYGDSYLVVKNSENWIDTDNYRIEITGEKLPV